MTFKKVETDSIAGITMSLIGQTVIMYVKTFRTDVIVFFHNVVMCITSHWQKVFSIKSQSLIHVDTCTHDLLPSLTTNWSQVLSIMMYKPHELSMIDYKKYRLPDPGLNC